MAPTAARSRVGTSWIASRGRPAAASPSRIASAMRRRGAEAFRAGAQDRGVAGLEAERAGIGGDVGPALEDHADDAERRRDALDVSPFGRSKVASTRPTGSGSSATLSTAAGDRLEARRVERSGGRGRRRSGPAARASAMSSRVGGEDRLRGRADARRPWRAAPRSSPRPSRGRAARRGAARRRVRGVGRSAAVQVFARNDRSAARPSIDPSLSARRAADLSARSSATASAMSSRWTISARPAIAEDAFDLAARAADDAAPPRPRRRRRGRGRATRRRIADHHRVAAREPPSTRRTPTGSRLAPRAQRPRRALVDVKAPRGSSAPAIQVLRAVAGVRRRQEPGAAAAVGDAAERVLRRARRR